MKIGAGHTLLVPGKGADTSADLLAVNLPVAKPVFKKTPSHRGKKTVRKKGTRAHKPAAGSARQPTQGAPAKRARGST
jgi:hypothetical protein